MSAPFQSYQPGQSLLMPPDLLEWLPKGHLAYFVMDVVGSLDLKDIYAYYDFEEKRNEKGEVVERRVKSSRGRPAYDPLMMTTLLIYAYVTGTPSSREIEKKCVEDVAFRVISADQHPDHSTIAEFRQLHLRALKALFLQVLRLCEEAGLVKLGHVALDGTKVKANASKHKAMSYEYMVKRVEELKQQIEELMHRAEQVDQAEDAKHGKGRRSDDLPEELARRESRLRKIQEAKAALEAAAAAAAEEKRREKAEHAQTPEKPGGPTDPPPLTSPPPEPPPKPEDKAQRNFTDPESRIMLNGEKAFIQGYNAQAAVDHEHQVIVACDVTNQAADAPHLVPMIEQIEANTGRRPDAFSADAGYFSEANIAFLNQKDIDAYVAAERLKHGEKPPAARGRIPEDATPKQRMIRKLRTLVGRAIYALRKVTVEPVFGQVRTRGLLRFWLRGVENVGAEWSLWCTGHNLLKLFRSGRLADGTA